MGPYRKSWMKRSIPVALACLVVALGLASGQAWALTISGQFHFRDNVGPNSVGSPIGDRQLFGVISVTPAGPPTVVTATQGATVVSLPFVPVTLFPVEYFANIPFDPALTGSWNINATRDLDSAAPVITNSLPDAPLLPLAQNLRVLNGDVAPLTPTLAWELPSLTGFTVTRIRIRIFDATTHDSFFDAFLSPVVTTFRIPNGRLQFGRSYVFSVRLEDLSPGFLRSRSSAFSDPYTPGAVTISGPFHYRENVGPNDLGLPAGDRQVFGAISVLPSGPPTMASAVQGTAVAPLTFFPLTLFPDEYVASLEFSPALTGPWTIGATRDGGSAATVATNPIPNPQLLPLVQNLRISGGDLAPLTPTLTWELPDLSGFNVTQIRVRIADAATKDQFFQTFLSPSATAFTIPTGLLQFSRSYVFRVMLEDTSPGYLQNRSSTFSAPYTPPINTPPINLNYIAIGTGEDKGQQDGVFDAFAFSGSVNNNGFTSLRTAFEFSLSGLPTGSTINSANLTMDLRNFEGTRSMQVHGYAGDGTVQLSDFALDGIVGTVSVGPVGTQRLTFDVTSFVAGLVASGQTFAGFNVREEPANTQNFVVMFLELAGGFLPRLSITFSKVDSPVANAGPDQTVNEDTVVHLDGSGSTGLGLSFAWTQVAGPTVSLTGATTPTPTFNAPLLDGGFGSQTLTFQLMVSNGGVGSSSDYVDVIVTNVNHAPTAEAGADQTVKEGSLVVLNGSASFDSDGDRITYRWVQTAGTLVALVEADTATPTFTAPTLPGGLGGPEILTFALTVSDGDLPSTDKVNVVVEQVNHPPVADPGMPQTVHSGRLVILDGTASGDPDTDPIGFRWTQIGGPAIVLANVTTPTPSFTAPPTGGPTALTFRLSVSDTQLDSEPADVVITVVNDRPLCDLGRAVPDLLWPPNHRMVPVAITGVKDPDDDTVKIQIVGVTQDEPVNGRGGRRRPLRHHRHGDASPDAVILNGTLLLRAERSGKGNGRVYHVDFTADDGHGGRCSGEVRVAVPRSMKPGAPIIDDGPLYDSTRP